MVGWIQPRRGGVRTSRGRKSNLRSLSKLRTSHSQPLLYNPSSKSSNHVQLWGYGLETCGKQFGTDRGLSCCWLAGVCTRIRRYCAVFLMLPTLSDHPSNATFSTENSTIREMRSLPSNVDNCSCPVKWHQQQRLQQAAAKILWHVPDHIHQSLHSVLQKSRCVCHQFQLIQHKRSSVPFISTHDANAPI